MQEDVNHMRTIDFSPLYRSVVGFDRLASLLETAAADAATGYPPYNIERTDENAYRVDIAVAGFRPEELNVEVKENLLTVTGRKAANDEAKTFLHRGLAERNFERRFQLADYVVVSNIAPQPPGSEDQAINVAIPVGAPGVKIYSRRARPTGSPR